MNKLFCIALGVICLLHTSVIADESKTTTLTSFLSQINSSVSSKNAVSAIVMDTTNQDSTDDITTTVNEWNIHHCTTYSITQAKDLLTINPKNQICSILFISSTLESTMQEWANQHSITVNAFNYVNNMKLGRNLGATGIAYTTSNTTGFTNTTQIYMVPAIMEGLLIGFFLLFFVFVGICCTLGINSPDVLHSTTLPAGKEY